MNVIVVGNAASLLDKRNGALIDSFDVVVRLNKYVIKGYEEHVGKKTDVYCSKWLNMSYNIDSVSNYKQVWLPYPEPPNWWTSRGNHNEVSLKEHQHNIDTHKLNKDSLVFLDKDRAREMEAVFKNTCHPSTGMIALMIAIQQFSNFNISYTGYDNFNTGWYWDKQHNCTKGMKNSILFEKIFLNYIKSKYGVTKL